MTAAFVVEEGTGPLIVEIPHAGTAIPDAFRDEIDVTPHAIARDADLFVDELYAGAPAHGATILRATVSRYVVDLNRAETDVDAESVVGGPASPRAPRGVIWRLGTDGEVCLRRPLSRESLEARLDAVHRPYHGALRRLISARVSKFGYAIVLAAHSMPSVGRTGHGDAPQGGATRADVVPGTQGRTSADPRFIDAVDVVAARHGLTVRHDDPYRGGFTTRFYGRPNERVHVVQVELARRLYMDEAALTKKPDDFERTQGFCADLVSSLVKAPAGFP